MPTSGVRLFLGEIATGAVLEADVRGETDHGVGFTKRVRYREFAPADLTGEAIFCQLQLVIVSFFGGETFQVTPFVDGVELDRSEFTLVGTTARRRHVVEINVTVPYEVDGIEQTRAYPRGREIEVMVEWDDLSDVVLEGVGVVWEPVGDSLKALTGPP